MNKSTFLISTSDEILSKAEDAGLGSVFIQISDLNQQTISKLNKFFSDKVHIYAEISVFNDKELAKKYSDSFLVESEGKEIPECSLCPTHPGVRDATTQKIKEALKMDIKGIWLNFIRYPTKWDIKEPKVLDVCYCDRCIGLFGKYLGEKLEAPNLEELALLIDGVYYHEWLEFKAEKITSVVIEAKKLIQDSGKDVKLGIFLVPWEDKEYGAGIQRVVAQDMSKLDDYLDLFSPMLYHKSLEKSVDWIKGKVEYYWQVGLPFLPIIQTENVSSEEFKKSLEYAVESPSIGVCVYSFDDLVKNPKNLKIFKDFGN